MQPRFLPKDTFELLFNFHEKSTAAFARAVFYEDRWKLLQFLEPQVWRPLSDSAWIDHYPKGGSQLAKDCALYVGCSPIAFVKRRKIEMASAWLRCGKRSNEIARVLGFSSAWEFQCMFGATTKRRCNDVRTETPLNCLSSDELIEAIVPFYWSEYRRTSGEQRTEDMRRFIRSWTKAAAKARRPVEMRRFSGQITRIPEEPPEERNESDATARKVLLAQAQDFFEMQTTAAEIVVPFFKDHPVRFPAAA